ncbi:Rieske (2Fe-2S) protein [Hyphococcus sp.]|uniref:Rieske (2Fe-2S) protein n=1 Tax=Hyphococcus sp. TaxID=2038636 RepID=UPI003CCC06F9
MTEGFVKAASVSDIAENENKAFKLGDVDVLICNTKEGFFAVQNECTHQLTELEGGRVRGCFIFCPLHGQRFNLKDGTPIGQLTDKPIKTYPVKIDGDDILVCPEPAGAPTGAGPG